MHKPITFVENGTGDWYFIHSLPNLEVKFDMPFTPVGDKRKGRDLERENQVFY